MDPMCGFVERRPRLVEFRCVNVQATTIIDHLPHLGGEVLVVVGPSGGGKSTLCRTINRLEPIDSGRIHFDGRPLPAEGRELARHRADVGMEVYAKPGDLLANGSLSGMNRGLATRRAR